VKSTAGTEESSGSHVRSVMHSRGSLSIHGMLDGLLRKASAFVPSLKNFSPLRVRACLIARW